MPKAIKPKEPNKFYSSPMRKKAKPVVPIYTNGLEINPADFLKNISDHEIKNRFDFLINIYDAEFSQNLDIQNLKSLDRYIINIREILREKGNLSKKLEPEQKNSFKKILVKILLKSAEIKMLHSREVGSNKDKKEADILKKSIQEYEEKANKIKVLTEKISFLMENSFWQEAFLLCQKTISENEKENTGVLWYLHGRILLEFNNYKEAEVSFKLSYEQNYYHAANGISFIKEKRLENRSVVLAFNADFLYEITEYVKALDNYHQAILESFKDHDPFRIRAACYLSQGMVKENIEIMTRKDIISDFEEALKLAETYGQKDVAETAAFKISELNREGRHNVIDPMMNNVCFNGEKPPNPEGRLNYIASMC